MRHGHRRTTALLALALALTPGAAALGAQAPPPPTPLPGDTVSAPVATPAPTPTPAPVATTAPATAPAAITAPTRATPTTAEAGRTGPDPFDWLRPAARSLVSSGAWPSLAGAPLGRDATRADLDAALAALGARPRDGGRNPAAPVSVWSAHLAVIGTLGLSAERRGLQALHTADGTRLRLPRNFGVEVLVRELGLVPNHPSDRDGLERSRREPMRLADLAYMVSRARELSSWDLQRMARYRDISLPDMNPARRAVVEAALAEVGRPYVWGGDWPGRNSPWGGQAAGGFDCSGLVWWAFKASPRSHELDAGDALLGRTADDMAFERPRQRIRAADARAGDLVFFGPRGPRSRRGTIGHVGVSLGGGWIVHSAGSRGGPSVSSLDTYWPSATAFARTLPALG